jgi:GrpB-like predicted nucleotidyltransferase (UPF0157 family)
MCQELQIVPYDPAWPSEFEAEAVRIRTALGCLAVRIDHHGSTSIPGLAAKPVIDIQVSVESLQPMSAYREPLCSIGYVHVPHTDDSFCPFFHRPSHWRFGPRAVLLSLLSSVNSLLRTQACVSRLEPVNLRQPQLVVM